MIISYGFSIAGLSHKENNQPCQDAYYIRQLGNGWVAVAVADGLGRSIHAEEASDIAVSAIEDIDDEYLPAAWDGVTACLILRDCFKQAYNKIIDESCAKGGCQEGFNTTLTMVLYNGYHLAYGHCGGGGVIGLDVSGRYQLITPMQKNEKFNTIISLNLGPDFWVFDNPPGEFCSLMLLTDGLSDMACPVLLKENGGVYILFVRQFMDAGVLNITTENAGEIEEAIKDFFNEDPSVQITGDKTMVCLIRSKFISPMKEDGYYIEPDWKKLREIERNKFHDNSKGLRCPSESMNL